MQTTVDFSNGDQVTSQKLDQIIGGATFTASDINGPTLQIVGGKMQAGVMAAANIGANAITTPAILDRAVTSTKIALGAVNSSHIANQSVDQQAILFGSIIYANFNPNVAATNAQVNSQADGVFMRPLNARYHPAAAKAYVSFTITGTGRTIRQNSFNIDSVTRIDSTHTQINFVTNMSAQQNYVSSVTVRTAGTVATASTYDAFAASIKVAHPAEAANLAIDLIIFGSYV